MSKITIFKKGLSVMWQDKAHLITDMQFVSPGKGSAFSKMKLKNLKTGQTQEVTIKSGDALEEADVGYKNTQFLYNDGEDYFFMDMDTFEQFSLDKSILGDQIKFFKDEVVCKTMYIDDVPCMAYLPLKMSFKVINSPPGVKGDTATGGSKFVTIETGVQVKVPLFIKADEMIRVNTETGEYLERANS